MPLNPLPPFVFIKKEVGETPLESLEKWREKNPAAKDLPLSYAGRLDPLASGLLLILIGEECKNQTNYHNLDKEYEFEVLFDVFSDSGDVLGLIEKIPQKTTNTDLIKEKIKTLIGTIKFPYPIFSAKTVKGKPLHTWAMEGKLDEITIPEREAKIFQLEIISSKKLSGEEVYKEALQKINSIPPVTDLRKALGNDFRREEVRESWGEFLQKNSPQDFLVVKFRCLCSSGSYMRTLADLIAQTISSRGLAFSIHRTKIGHFDKNKNELISL